MTSAQRHLLPVILALVGLCSPAKAQSFYSAIQDAGSFGYLDQFSLNVEAYDFIGAEACVPTSSVNVMTYLQNSFPDYFGTGLTGLTYADWIDADTTLISPGYMNTSSPNGTLYNHIHFGLNKYIVQDRGFANVQFSGMIPFWDSPDRPAPEERPSTMADSFPTWNFLYDVLNSSSGTVLGLTYPSRLGHAVALGGFEWTDLNSNGRLDYLEATLYFVDPLDPTKGMDPSGGANFTTGNLWSAMVPDPSNPDVLYDTLVLEYEQYEGTDLWGGALGGSTVYGTTTAYITAAVAISIPEPAPLALLGLTAFGAILFLHRKKTARTARFEN